MRREDYDEKMQFTERGARRTRNGDNEKNKKENLTKQPSFEAEEDYSVGSLPSVRTEASTHPTSTKSSFRVPSSIHGPSDDEGEDNAEENEITSPLIDSLPNLPVTFPGAVRVGRSSNGSSITWDEEDNSIVMGTDGGLNAAHPSPLIHAELVVEQGTDEPAGESTQRLESEPGNRWPQRYIIICSVSVVVVVAITATTIVFSSVVGRGTGGAGSSGARIPTVSPTVSPTELPTGPNDKETDWINLIQSKMPATEFGNTASPQGQALDWMLRDRYTLSLEKDDRIIQRFALAVLFHATGGATTWEASSGAGWLESSTECVWGERSGGQSDVQCTDDTVDRIHVPASDGNSQSIFQAPGYLSPSVPREIGLLSALTLLGLHGSELEGTIPSEVGMLSLLSLLDLHGNKLNGTIPTELCLLTSLTTMDLDNNHLEGIIPAKIGMLSAIVTARLASNALTGTIPTEIGQVTSLEMLNLHDNTLEGAIPSEIGLLASATSLSFSFNRNVSGFIPKELANLFHLRWLYFESTNVSGSIPSSLCDGNQLARAVIDCSKVECDCCVYSDSSQYVPCPLPKSEDTHSPTTAPSMPPSSFPTSSPTIRDATSAPSPTTLMTSNPTTVPTSISNPTTATPTLHSSTATPMTVPTTISNPTTATPTLYLLTATASPNPASSTPTPSLITLTPTPDPISPVPTTSPTSLALTPHPTSVAPTPSPVTTDSRRESWISLIRSRTPWINFDDATSPRGMALDWILQDSYTIALINEDDRIVQRFGLAVFYYSTNGPAAWRQGHGWLGESKPECAWGEPDVHCTNRIIWGLKMYQDGLSGSIPQEIGLLSTLSHLSLGDNALEGTIPTTIGMLSVLTALFVFRNELEGTIPSEVGLLTDLTGLRLYENNLEGTIPSEIGLLAALTEISLNNNPSLGGSVPPELANLTNLRTLLLHSTNLSGTIPSNLCGALGDAEIDSDEIECDCCANTN